MDTTMTFLVAVKTKDTKAPYGYKHFEVPEEVYIYIKQLEGYVSDPKSSKLLEVYKERFNNASNS